MNRNGFKHYGQMQPGDKVIIYKITPERGIYGTAIVVEGMQRNQPIPGRTDSTAVKIKYIEDITPRTIYELDREPQLRAQYFLNEKWNESVTEITRVQYDTCLNPSTDLEPIQSPTIQQMIDTATYSARRSAMEKHMKDQIDQLDQQLSTQRTTVSRPSISHKPKIMTKPWKMIYVFSLPEHFNGVDTAIKYLQLKRNALKIYIADAMWTNGNLYGQYVKEDDDIVFHQGIITEALSSPLKNNVLIEDFHHLNAILLKPLIHAARGDQVSLPVMKELTRATIGLGEEATYQLDQDFKVIALTTLTIDAFKEKYPVYMHPFMKFYAYK